jgi:hypothetical protein
MLCLTDTDWFLTTGVNSGRRFKSPRGLRRGSSAVRLLGLWVRIPLGISVVSVLCCQIEVPATGRSLVQRSATECCLLIECHRVVSAVKMPRLTTTVKPVFRQAFIEDTKHFIRNDQQYALICNALYSMYWLLHVSAVACHHQGASSILLSYVKYNANGWYI